MSKQSPKAKAHRKDGAKVTLWLKAKTAPASTSTTTAPAAGTIRPTIDPAYVQSPTDPLNVTWTYSVSDTDGTLPDGVLSLTVYVHGQIADSGGCTIDVGASVSGGTCTLELPAYGLYDVIVTYDSGDPSVAPSTQTDTEDIEDPNGTAPTWEPITLTLAAGQVSVLNFTGPPPTYLQTTTTTVPLAITTPDEAPDFTVTITDVTSGATATGTWDSSVTCGLQFGGPSSTSSLSGCGIASMPFSYTDVLDAVVTSQPDFPYEAATSATVEVWSGALPPNAIVQ